MDEIRKPDTAETSALGQAASDAARSGSGVVAGASAQVPVFRDGRFSGFVQRVPSEAPTGPAATSDDMETQNRLSEALTRQLGLQAGRVGVTVEKGIVHLFGRADGCHAVLAARRVAAAAPDTAAIIDDLWVECE